MGIVYTLSGRRLQKLSAGRWEYGYCEERSLGLVGKFRKMKSEKLLR